jgi:signal transduction histidine kinase
VDLVALAGQQMGDKAELSRKHDLTLNTSSPELIGRWDAERLERLLGNLLANAINYSPEGGPIEVGITTDAGGCEAIITVRDQGLGIPPDDLPHIFDRFHRGRNVVNRIPGSGIGLTGARQIVEEHGGTIAVESEEGKGTTFTVRLPITAEE